MMSWAAGHIFQFVSITGQSAFFEATIAPLRSKVGELNTPNNVMTTKLHYAELTVWSTSIEDIVLVSLFFSAFFPTILWVNHGIPLENQTCIHGAR